MTGRFEHLDFDGLPDPPKPKRPAPVTGAQWAKEKAQPPVSRYQITSGPCSIRLPSNPPEVLWLNSGDNRFAKLPAPSVVTVNLDTRWRYDPSAEEMTIELTVQQDNLGDAWAVTSRIINTRVLSGLRNQVDVMRRTVAPGTDVVLTADPDCRNPLGMIRVYIERKERGIEQAW